MIAVPMDQLLTIPIRLNSAEISGRLRFDPIRAGFASLDGLIELAERLIRARAAYEVAYIGAKGEGTVEVAGVAFQSPVLRKNLDLTNKVFPYIITVGPDLEREAAAQDDLLKQYYLEEMANIALEHAAAWLTGQIEESHGVGPLSNMSPGSLEDWPITADR
jgi:hypothetical protein